jgi:hypothetical protein
LRTRIASSRFWVAERSFWQVTTMFVGRWVRRIADSVLPAGARRPERVDPDLVPVELDLDVLVGLGHDLDQGEGRLAAVLGVVGADPDEAVDATLGAQPAIGEPPGDGDRGALDARLLAGLGVDHVGLEPVALAPAQVHPQEHVGPVGRLGPARAGADRHDRVLGVVLAREQEQRALARELRPERVRLTGEVSLRVGIGRVGEQLLELLEIGHAPFEGPPGLDLVAQALGLADGLLGRSLVVPEPRLDRTRVELRDP